MFRHAIPVAVAIAVLFPLPVAAQEDAADRIVNILALEFKMRKSVEELPFPNTLEVHPELEGADGFRLLPPGTEAPGEWGVDAYQFMPGTIVVYQGEDVLLRFFGVNGDVHDVTIEGFDEAVTVRRGELTEVMITADTLGTFQITCHTHPPIMNATLVVLPAPE